MTTRDKLIGLGGHQLQRKRQLEVTGYGKVGAKHRGRADITQCNTHMICFSCPGVTEIGGPPSVPGEKYRVADDGE